MWASVFDRGERRPIAQLKGAPGLLEIRISKRVQMKVIAGSEYQMIERAKLCEQRDDGPFVREINLLTIHFSADGLYGLLDSFRVA
jgi:hypothetical protein